MNEETKIRTDIAITSTQAKRLPIYLESADNTSNNNFYTVYWCILGRQNDGPEVWIQSNIHMYQLIRFVRRRWDGNAVSDSVDYTGEHVQKEFKENLTDAVRDDPRPFIRDYIENSGQVLQYEQKIREHNTTTKHEDAYNFWTRNPDQSLNKIAEVFGISHSKLSNIITKKLKEKRYDNIIENINP